MAIKIKQVDIYSRAVLFGVQVIEFHFLWAGGGSYLPGGDGAQDIDDAVRLLLSLLGILFAKQAAAAQEKGKPRVTTHSPMFTIYSMFAVQLTSQLQCQQGTFPVYGNSHLLLTDGELT